MLSIDSYFLQAIDFARHLDAQTAVSYSPLRPHSRAALLAIIKRVMDGDVGDVGPVERGALWPSTQLDTAQSILVKQGGDVTLPWMWSVWDDERILDYYVVEQLVSAPLVTIQ